MESVATDNFVSDFQIPEMFNLDDVSNDNGSMFNPAETLPGKSPNVLILNDINLNASDNNLMTLNFDEEGNAPFLLQSTTSDNASDSRCCSLSSCKCYQKLSNKMEWVQKKIFNELNSIRGEIMFNRELLSEVLSKVQHQDGEQAIAVQDEEKETETLNLLSSTLSIKLFLSPTPTHCMSSM